MAEEKAGTGTPAANGVQNNSEKAEKTVKYRVDVDCYWDSIYWFEDSVVELPADKKPPEVYFKKI
jgi:hypothetical protein